MGHIFIYVRNDETGNSAYFDFWAENRYTVLGDVSQLRIDAHASLTIETSAAQEQAIFEVIMKMQEGPPNYDVNPIDSNGFAQCTNLSMNLLREGNINVSFIEKFEPSAAWQRLFLRYAPESLKVTRVERGDRGGWQDVTSVPNVKPGDSFGKDPRGQARTVDPHAVNNRKLLFRDGKRMN